MTVDMEEGTVHNGKLYVDKDWGWEGGLMSIGLGLKHSCWSSEHQSSLWRSAYREKVHHFLKGVGSSWIRAREGRGESRCHHTRRVKRRPGAA